ncbi:hypothetical protein [Neobacillus jeddahensis]|uniref:hypothetical protein n=1 Tax=Neobacillus jeddahensis TaxID=1461580 RepID=UPI00058AC003|nr:hypothetical protein [Neobacillus jeddahensis]
MDIKEQALLHGYYQKLIDNTLDEKDVYAFLLLISNRNKEIRWMNELADAVIHREQHKGAIKEFLFETKTKFESLGKTKQVLRIEDVFSFKEIKNGMNKTLTEYQLPGLTNEKVNDFITCLISLLQQIKIVDEQGREIGKLFFAISSKQIILMAEMEVAQNFLKKTNAVFPVLTTNNDYVELKKQDKYDTPYLFTDKVIEVTNQTGKLEIIVPE